MQHRLSLSPVGFSLLLAACTPIDEADDSDPNSDSDPPVGDAEFVQLLYLDDGPGDLDTNAAGQLLIATRYGGHVLSWSPGSDGTDTVERSVSGLEGIHVGGGEKVWAAVSDGGMEGAVGWLEDSDLVSVASQADDGTLFRYPRDVALAPDGQLVMVDATVGALFRTDPATGSTTAHYLEIASPRCLLFLGETLYVGGSDGIYTVDYPGNTATRVDNREAWGLLEHDGRVLAANDDAKIFELRGDSIGGAKIGRPGGMAMLDGTLYVSDLVGSYLWSLELE